MQRCEPLDNDWSLPDHSVFSKTAFGFGATSTAAVVSAVLFGLAPAVQATRPNVMQAARGDFSRDFRPARLRNALVAGQITMCALLLICAGVLLRGARRLANFDVGQLQEFLAKVNVSRN